MFVHANQLDDRLVEWFLSLYAARTPPQSVLDAHPDYRVTWHETAAKMKELGYEMDAVAKRIHFGRLFADRRLRAACNKLIRATGATTLVTKECEISKATRDAHPD